MRSFSVASKQTFDDLLPCGELITRPKDGIFVTLVERNRKAWKHAKDIVTGECLCERARDANVYDPQFFFSAT